MKRNRGSSKAPAQRPGEKFRDGAACPEIVVVPAGSFLMGSPENEEGQDGDEGPVHGVTIAEAFAVGVYEVTFAEWDSYWADGNCDGYRPDDNGWGRGRRPVINVSWEDAKDYLRWLSEKTGQEYRLLSEAEWEYAARAGSRTRYSFGDDILPNQANYGDSGYGKTIAVGSYRSNDFGLYDMHGNVYEWVQDCWNGNYDGAPSDGRAWENRNCSLRVLRGGSWFDHSRALRAANRSWTDAGLRINYDVGFRVARTLTP